MTALRSIKIQGYRPFGLFSARLGALEVCVGANGSGKSSLFEFLKFLRDSLRSQEIPPEIVSGGIGQQIFHRPGPEWFSWNLEIEQEDQTTLTYSATLLGPIGRPTIPQEKICEVATDKMLLDFNLELGQIGGGLKPMRLIPKRGNQLALASAVTAEREELYRLKQFVQGWKFYSVGTLAIEKIRKAALVEQEPVLREDASNLSSVLHYLKTEHPAIFDNLQQHLRSAVPGFSGLSVKARGGPGEIMAFWQEKGVDGELSLADLSDGILRLICWMVLCVQPNPPTLICIDEPDQGVHPRTLPILAGLFQQASQRTQIFLATHSSYFLTQFDIEEIAVFRKENGEARFLKPKDSQTLTQNLADFGLEELEIMHRNDELERLA
jgi:predicted ATPase